MNPSPYIDRKEISQLTNKTERTVRDNEKRWGLNSCRARFSKRPVLYRRSEAIALLSKIGVITAN